MLDPNLREWEVLAWLTSLLAITFIDAIKELQWESSLGNHCQADPELDAARERIVSGAHELFDRSADEDLYPELKPALALCRSLGVRPKQETVNDRLSWRSRNHREGATDTTDFTE